MDQTTTVAAATTTTTSVDSWVEDTSLHQSNHRTTAVAHGGGLNKLRLMCSYGGHIVPRPHDKSLCYVGGDTRIVVVDRRTTLSHLTHRLTKTLTRSNPSSTMCSFTIKYQLPSEDLDSLISVSTDEDLENMIDEYERLYERLNVNSISDCSKSSRIRLFLFPTKPESVSSIGSVLETASRSEDWFVNALNGTPSGFSDTSSVNCLLGLEDDVLVPEKKDVSNVTVVGKNCLVQDVQSVPDSPMLETSSSFGSASSTPSLVNLPVVTVNVDDQQKVVGEIEEHFCQMSLQQQLKHQEDVKFVVEPSPVVITDDHHKQQQQHQRKPSTGFDLTSPDSVSSDGSITKPLVICQDPAAHSQFHTNIDQNTGIQIQQQQIQDSAYMLSNSATRIDPQNHQQHHQSQFIHNAVQPAQYLHQYHPSGAVPMASFYQIHPSQTQYYAPQPVLDQHNFVYYMPASQPPQGYNNASPAVSTPSNSQVPPPSGLFTTPQAVQSAAKTDPPAGVYRTTISSGSSTPQLVQGPSSQQQMQPQFVSYSHIYQPSQANPSGGGGSGGYLYEFADPSQHAQHLYYAAQPLVPQSAAQYQPTASTLPVEAQAGSHLQAGNSMNQHVRTSQP